MVFFLQQGAGIGMAISTQDRNRDGGGTKVGFEKRVPSLEVSGRKVNIGEGGSQEVAPRARTAWLRGLPGGRSRRAPPLLVGPLWYFFVPSGVFWNKRFFGF